MKAPERIETPRLLLCRPGHDDAPEIYARYGSDPEVTRYMSFPTHRTPNDAHLFVSASDEEWARWPAGPFLVRLRADNTLIGGTGLHFETPHRAMTGYILAKDAWGKGFATEVLGAIVDLARSLGVIRLYSYCHTEHERSCRVLEKCGFAREGVLRSFTRFPNLPGTRPLDVVNFARIL